MLYLVDNDSFGRVREQCRQYRASYHWRNTNPTKSGCVEMDTWVFCHGKIVKRLASLFLTYAILSFIPSM
jgi:hypothetical protein